MPLIPRDVPCLRLLKRLSTLVAVVDGAIAYESRARIHRGKSVTRCFIAAGTATSRVFAHVTHRRICSDVGGEYVFELILFGNSLALSFRLAAPARPSVVSAGMR